MNQRKRIAVVGLAIAALAVGLVAYGQMGSSGAASRIDLNTRDLSYALGFNIGQRFSQNDVEIDPGQLAAGLKASLSEKKDPRLSEQEIQQIMAAFQKQLAQQRRAKQQAQAKENIDAGQQFLKQNKQNPGVKETSSGLQYKVLEEGTGQAPGPNERVRVHYKGQLLNGTTFDSSYKRGEPATFQVSQVIKGWGEALQMMKPGSRWKLWIPANLAYGKRSVGSEIKPGSTLVFEVELLGVK